MTISTDTSSLSEPRKEPRDTRRWLLLAAVLGATLMAGLDVFIVNVAIPSIERELHAGLAAVQLVAAGYTLAYAVLLTTGGRLGDLYGRKRLFLLGVGGFTLGSALCGVAPSADLLIVFRVAQGAVAALMVPQVLAFIQVSFDPLERPLAFSAYAATLGLASILGQLLGGVLLAVNLLGLGWRSIFLVNVPVGLVVWLAALLVVRESRRTSVRSHLDHGGMTLLTLALALFIFPLVLGSSTGWPLWTWLCLLLSVPCLLAFLAYERRITRRDQLPLVSLALFSLRSFSVGTLTNLLNNALFAACLFLFSIYLQTIRGFTPLHSGFAFTVGSLGYILASSTSTHIVRRLGKRHLSQAAGGVTLGYLLLLLTGQWLAPAWSTFSLLIAFFVLCFSQGLLYTPLMRTTLEEVAPSEVGAASGVYATTIQTANTLGVAIIGVIFAGLISWRGNALQAFGLTLLLLMLLSLGSFLLVRLLEP